MRHSKRDTMGVMMKRLGMIASAALSLTVAAGEPVKVIFDTDMYADFVFPHFQAMRR